MQHKTRPAWVEIDLNNLRYNMAQIKEKANGARVIGVVKADAYGHGMEKVASVMAEEGIRDFAVATPEEALTLRDLEFADEILILGLTDTAQTETLIWHDISLVADSLAMAEILEEQAIRAGRNAKVFIAIDTGMGRIGYLTDDPKAVEEVAAIAKLPHVEIRGLISHFATADEADKEFAELQAARYREFAEKLTSAGIDVPTKTLANSAAIMEMDHTLYNAVRPGIIQYGYYPSSEVDRSQLSLKPVMSVHAKIAKIKTVPAGYSCGYGRKFIADRDSVIATLPIGYADGYPRPYSPYAKVLINGIPARVAGNICMDQCMVDITDFEGLSVGDEVIIMGGEITADTIAEAIGTINYEVLCGFGMRLPRRYIDSKDD